MNTMINKHSTVSILLIAGLFLVFTGSALGYGTSSNKISEYPFHSTCPLTDVSGNNNDLTCNGGVTTGQTGISQSQGDWDYDDDGSFESYLFDGASGTSASGNIPLTTSDQITVSFWAQPQEDTSGPILTDVLNGSSSQSAVFVQLQGSGEIKTRFVNESGNIVQLFSGTGKFSTGDWVHVVATYKPGNASFYVNNSLVATQNPGLNNLLNYDKVILANHHGGFPANTYIDEYKVYNEFSTTSEVDSLYNQNQKTSNSAPSVNSVEYEVSNSWIPSNNLNFNDQVTRIRANITDPDSDSISSTSLTLEDLYDSNTRLSGVSHTSTSGDYFIFDITDQTLDDSGDWETSVEATDSNGATGSSTDSYSLPWGSISVSMSQPSTDISVQQNKTFTVSGSASCSGGECSSEGEVTELWVDPRPASNTSEKVKVGEIKGSMTSSEQLTFEEKVHSHGGKTRSHKDQSQRKTLFKKLSELVDDLI